MFLFRASRYLEELETHRSDIAAACQKAVSTLSSDLDFTRIDSDAFIACPDDSVDYEIMEKTNDAVMARDGTTLGLGHRFGTSVKKTDPVMQYRAM